MTTESNLLEKMVSRISCRILDVAMQLWEARKSDFEKFQVLNNNVFKCVGNAVPWLLQHECEVYSCCLKADSACGRGKEGCHIYNQPQSIPQWLLMVETKITEMQLIASGCSDSQICCVPLMETTEWENNFPCGKICWKNNNFPLRNSNVGIR